jgi:hypothetical protein
MAGAERIRENERWNRAKNLSGDARQARGAPHDLSMKHLILPLFVAGGLLALAGCASEDSAMPTSSTTTTTTEETTTSSPLSPVAPAGTSTTTQTTTSNQ